MVLLALSWSFECSMWLSRSSCVLLSFMGFWYVRREQHKIIKLLNQVLVHQCHGFLLWWTCLLFSSSSNHACVIVCHSCASWSWSSLWSCSPLWDFGV
jgi:hypothetical protein